MGRIEKKERKEGGGEKREKERERERRRRKKKRKMEVSVGDVERYTHQWPSHGVSWK